MLRRRAAFRRTSARHQTTRTPSEPACCGASQWLRVLKRALVARGLTISSRTVSCVDVVGPRAEEACPVSACLRQSRSTACFVGVRVSRVSARQQTTRTPSEPACFGGSIGSPAQAGSCGSRSNESRQDGDLAWTSLDREPKKHARYRRICASPGQRHASSACAFLGYRSPATTRTPSEPACFGGSIGCACSSGLLWLAV